MRSLLTERLGLLQASGVAAGFLIMLFLFMEHKCALQYNKNKGPLYSALIIKRLSVDKRCENKVRFSKSYDNNDN